MRKWWFLSLPVFLWAARAEACPAGVQPNSWACQTFPGDTPTTPAQQTDLLFAFRPSLGSAGQASVLVQQVLEALTLSQVTAALGFTPLSATGNGSGVGIISVPAGTVSRTAASRAVDPGFSVLDAGAKCDGVTDDTAKMTAALTSGNQFVTIPAGAICYSASGITVPSGVNLRGLSFSPGNPPTGSEILCAGTVSNCVKIGSGGTSLQTQRVENLIVATNATSTPTGTCIEVGGAYNITLQRVFTYNCGEGYILNSTAANQGLGIKMIEDYGGKIADAYITANGWPELRMENGRFGMNGNGDLAATAFLRIEGGNTLNPGGSGPNTIYVENTQFNQGGSNRVAYWLQFQNCAGTCVGGGSGVNASEFRFEGVHTEGLSTAYITSDSTWNTLDYLGLVNNVFASNVPFLALNAATGMADSQIVGNFIKGAFTLAPSTNLITGFAVVGNTFGSAVSITSGASASSMGWIGNSVAGNLTFAGPWLALTALGGEIRNSGVLANSATGGVSVNIPGATAGSLLTDNTAVNFPVLDGETGDINTVGTTEASGVTASRFNNGSGSGGRFVSQTTNSATYGTHGAVTPGEVVGSWYIYADDGTTFRVPTAQIQSVVDGTVSTGIVEGALAFNLANASGTMSNALRLDGNGKATFYGNIASNGSAPTPSGCGGGTPAVLAGSTSLRGTVTEGTSATGCTLTWASGYAFGSTPVCTLSSPNGAPWTGYTPGTTTLAIANANASGNEYSWHCFQ